jgi:hypothetical protein
VELQFVQAYEVLGVKPWAAEAEVREAHAELEAAWNAAPSSDPTGEQERATVNAAFEAIRAAGFPKDPGAQAAPNPAAQPPRAFPAYTPDFSSSVYQTQRSGVNSGRLVVGIVLIVVGVVITAVSYDAAASSESGGNYIVAFGPIVAGVIQVFKALVSN